MQKRCAYFYCDLRNLVMVHKPHAYVSVYGEERQIERRREKNESSFGYRTEQ